MTGSVEKTVSQEALYRFYQEYIILKVGSKSCDHVISLITWRLQISYILLSSTKMSSSNDFSTFPAIRFRDWCGEETKHHPIVGESIEFLARILYFSTNLAISKTV